MGIEALDLLYADDALVLGLMREHRRAGDIADCIDAGHIGAAETISQDYAFLGLHPQCFEAEIFDISDDANR
jgi:hypothetical protein